MKMQADEKVEVIRAAGGVTLATFYGFSLNEVVAMVTIFYMVLQTIILLPKIYTIFTKLRKK